jgi:hypothetical protein
VDGDPADGAANTNALALRVHGDACPGVRRLPCDINIIASNMGEVVYV